MRIIGQDYQPTYTAIGDAVHLTQRLQAAARPSEILVSDKTRQLVASLFRFSEPSPSPSKALLARNRRLGCSMSKTLCTDDLSMPTARHSLGAKVTSQRYRRAWTT
jgi:hypothetical protein